MTPKKKLITRIARWLCALLVVGGLIGLIALAVDGVRYDAWKSEQQELRAGLVQASRAYVDELAGRIDTTPVDLTLVGEIESRYFDEYQKGPMAIWAMATDGGFLFGVPRESFSRMNALYDREITPRLEDGVFFDRQVFFLGQLSDGVGPVSLDEWSSDEPGNEDELWQHLASYGDRDGDSFVLSAPLKTADGAALGSLYMSRSMPQRNYYSSGERTQAAMTLGGVSAGLSFLALWLLLPTWVYVDAREKGVARATLFAFLTAVSSVVGLLVYLIARPESATVSCPGCDHEVEGGAFCPHCGQDLVASFCQTCRYPLEAGWAYCPSCRTSTGAPVLEADLGSVAGDEPALEPG